MGHLRGRLQLLSGDPQNPELHQERSELGCLCVRLSSSAPGTELLLLHRSIPIVQVLRTTALTNACADHSDQRVVYLEHVVVRISISHPRRGDLQIHLISPSGTKSQLLAKR